MSPEEPCSTPAAAAAAVDMVGVLAAEAVAIAFAVEGGWEDRWLGRQDLATLPALQAAVPSVVSQRWRAARSAETNYASRWEVEAGG